MSLARERRQRRYRLGGFVLVDTLVSVMIAAIAAGMALQLLVWAMRETSKTAALNAQTQVLSLLYEQARLETPSDLDRPLSGKMGPILWSRYAEVLPGFRRPVVAPRRVVFELHTEGAHPLPVTLVESVIWPAGPESEN